MDSFEYAKAKRLHLEHLQSLSIEERLKAIESWIYEQDEQEMQDWLYKQREENYERKIL